MTETEAAARRSLLRNVFLETLRRIDITHCMHEATRSEPGALIIGGHTYRRDAVDRVVIVSIGKAAFPMARVACEHVLSSGLTLSRAIAIGSGDDSGIPAEISVIRGSHPFPDPNSRVTALQVIEALRGLTERDLVLFLVSGGSSAMIELPLNKHFSTGLVADFHRALVHSGLGIKAMNTLRKHFSAVKGGRLAFIAGRAQKHTLLVSDVPDGEWDVIGSGPSLPDSSTREDCWRILSENAATLKIPASVSSWFYGEGLPETPKAAEPCFEGARVSCLMSTRTMLNVAAELCSENGWDAVIDITCDDWDYRTAGDYLMDRLEREVRSRGRACLVSGGEVLVSVSAEHGVGGRNQQFALYCATRLPQGMTATLISVGSDGVDGNSPAAGAIVDSTTIERGQQIGLSATEALRRFDTYPFFKALGGDVTVRPTGNNVRDLRILLGERS